MHKYVSGICFILLTHSLAAQVWTQPANGYYGQVSFSTATYQNAYDSAGNTISLFPFQIEDLNIQLYGTYGITDKLTASLKIPWAVQKSKYIDTVEIVEGSELAYREAAISYFGNIEAGVIYKLKEKYPIVSASLFIETSTQDHHYVAGISSGFDAWSLKPGVGMAGVYKKLFYSAYAAADIKTNNYSSGILNILEVGYKPSDLFFVAGNLTSRASFYNSEYCPCYETLSGMYFNNQEYVTFSLKPGFQFNSAGLNFGYSLALLGKNIPSAGVFTVGFSYKKKQ